MRQGGPTDCLLRSVRGDPDHDHARAHVLVPQVAQQAAALGEPADLPAAAQQAGPEQAALFPHAAGSHVLDLSAALADAPDFRPGAPLALEILVAGRLEPSALALRVQLAAVLADSLQVPARG